MSREARWLALLVFGLLTPSDCSFTRLEYGVTDRVAKSLLRRELSGRKGPSLGKGRLRIGKSSIAG
jgi:hypothetical protein